MTPTDPKSDAHAAREGSDAPLALAELAPLEAVDHHLCVVRRLCERAQRSMARAARAVASSRALLARALRLTRAHRAIKPVRHQPVG